MGAINLPLHQAAELILGKGREFEQSQARQRDHCAKVDHHLGRVIHQAVDQRGCGVVAPEPLKLVDGAAGIRPEQAVPGQEGGDRSERGAAQSDDLTVIAAFSSRPWSTPAENAARLPAPSQNMAIRSPPSIASRVLSFPDHPFNQAPILLAQE